MNNEEDIDTTLDDIHNDNNDGGFGGSNFTLHQKTPIAPKSTKYKRDYTCNYCHKKFTRNSSLSRHLNERCKVRKKNDREMAKLLNRLVKQMEEQNIQMKDLKKTNKKLRRDVKNIKSNTTHTNSHNTNTNNNTNNIQQNINLLSFGKDNMESISNEEIKKILKRGFKSIQLMTKKTNFDPDIPENHNVYVNNIKSQYAITYNKGRWELDRVEDVIDRIYDDKYGFLEQKYHELKAELTPYDRKKIERILDEYEGVKRSKIFDKIKLVLYNNRHIPLRTRSIMKL
uniref:C2H2 type zinc finger protein n=1 Tax=Mimivirus LCMiAC02 TaxID=2506609 RepID=A0A481Z0D1_9VIRU|nr:MAG: C2H2 type zinc finger protein [Mimivirus LCMiAC02]